nr:EOG090X0431 [Macrothrix elegans]
MGDGKGNTSSQQQQNAQQASQGWATQYANYYGYGGITSGQAYGPYPFQVQHGQMAFYPYGYGYGMAPTVQGQWINQGGWGNATGSNGYQLPPVSTPGTSSIASSSTQPPLPTLPPPPPPPPPPATQSGAYEPPPPGSGTIKFTIPSKPVNKLQVKSEKPTITIKIPQYPAGMQVSSNQSVQENLVVTTTSQSKGSSMPVDWPDSLRRYVERCFAMCKSSVDKDLVELILKGKITAASREGTALTKDWDNEPLPNLPKERQSRSLLYIHLNSKTPINHSSPPPVKKLTKNQQKKLKKKNQKKLLNVNAKTGVNQPSPEKLRKRQARFQVPKGPKARLAPFADNILYREDVAGDEDWSHLLIIGTCLEVEKPFFRLTAAPDPSTVRPVPVLKKALSKVKSAWMTNQDYRWCCDQMKSIRQDLTVQGVRDSFTVEVYETHARLALEAADHEEFNQCQTQLKGLHHDVGGENRLEFTAYRILYYIFTKSTMDLTVTLASLTSEEKANECVAHALGVRSSWALANFRRFFRLFNAAPRMSAYLMSWFAERERKLALKTIIKAYRPNIPVDLVTTQLGFSTRSNRCKLDLKIFLLKYLLTHDNYIFMPLKVPKEVPWTCRVKIGLFVMKKLFSS